MVTLYLLIAAVMAVTFIPLALVTCEGRGDCAARLGITVVFVLAWPVTVLCAIVLSVAFPLLVRR